MRAKFNRKFPAIFVFLLISFYISISESSVQSRKIENQEIKTEPHETNQNGKVQFNADEKTIILKPSTILSDLEKHKKSNPEISVEELVNFGNAQLLQKGFNYSIDVCDLTKKKIKTKEVKNFPINNDNSPHLIFPYQMSLIDASRKTFQIIAPLESNAPCGYCYADIPVLGITDKKLVLISDGKTYSVNRPQDLMGSEEYFLVDEKTMKKQLRKWQIPFETQPLGISEDGKKIYVAVNYESILDEIVLEISDDGSLSFKSFKNIPSSKGIPIENHPKDKNNAYLGFMRFNSGNNNYIVKFSYPCT